MSTQVHPLRRRGIGRLPFELLVEIFMLASTTQYDAEKRRVPPSNLLLAFSHVCGSWRTVVRSAPQLWTIISGTESPPLMRETIVLSRRLPLVLWNEYDNDKDDDEDDDDDDDDEGKGDEDEDDTHEEWDHLEEPISDHVEYYEDKDTSEDLVGDIDKNNSGNHQRDEKTEFYPLRRGVARMLFAELHRMTAIRILVHRDDAPALPPLLAGPAPLLTSLDVKVRDLEEPLVINPFGGTVPPRLTRLSLKGGFEIPWDSPTFTHLTYLHLMTTVKTYKYQPKSSYQLFARALSQMASLQTLELVACIPDDIPDIESDILEIPLPRLTNLLVSDYVSNCAVFLESIQCELETLRVMDFEDPDSEEWPDYVSVCLSLLNACKGKMALRLTTTPLTSITVEARLGDIRVRGVRECPDGSADDSDTPLNVVICGNLTGDSESYAVDERLIAHALNMVPPHEGCTVELKLCDEVYDPPVIAEYLDKFDGGIRHDSVTVEKARQKGECWCMRDDCSNTREDNADSDLIGDEGQDCSNVEANDIPAPYKELLADLMLPSISDERRDS
ncbi:hypothetical protein EYR40_006109 [Pleurotus pulmonarius]|nr:hypothetical protein EYR36_010728 [Pleurotus pulmonarius]KAF4567114.1 hypothetical protein EYR36_010730 [Pleurotus pulmonarius]KAF4599019.1 hypothetical protein EYR40_006107 [Pleurotus pulmonarius]KAF4599021.1 hypothetical protein EYR40_006109 [Pleurotus pulmonarius]